MGSKLLSEVVNKPPNVLLIMTDQHRADHVGFAGNNVVSTPHLDSIADRGMRWDSAYVASPLCAPNRCSIMTSVMPSVHRTYSNGVALDPRHNTFVRRLRESGWRTGLVGKSHLQNMGHTSPSVPLVPDDGLDLFDLNQPAGWDLYELLDRFDDGPAGPDPEDFYGFEHVEFATDHGDLVGGHYRQWLRSQGIDWRDYQDPSMHGLYNPTVDPVYRPTLPEELYPTTFVAERSVDFVEQAARDERPWMLQCSFPDPHHPFTPPGRFFDRYDPADMELPFSFHDDHERSVPFLKRKFATRGTPGGFYAWAPTEDQLRRAMAAQYGMIDMVDEAVGRVLDSLTRTGQMDNTIILFTSDHGELMGDHGLLLKILVHYTGVLRVPLVLAGPGIARGTSGSLASSLDIGPTILDLVGVAPPVGVQGVSLVPTISEPEQRLRSEVLVEDDFKHGRDAFGIGKQNRMRTVVTESDRYTRYIGTDWTEWFSLAEDPHEMVNLAGTDPAGEGEMKDRLIDAMAMHDDVSRRPTHLA